jgi:hypothetical protein
MSYRRRHRWFRRMALGLAFASVIFAGRVSVAAAKFDEGTSGSRYVTAGGWSGQVDMESGIPLSAGIPHGDEQFVDAQAVQVVPYLSQGILTQEQADAAAAEAIRDPYLTDVFVRPGESLGGPDGLDIALQNAIESQSVVQAEAIHDPYLTDVFVRPGESLGGPDGSEAIEKSALAAQSGISSDELAFTNAVVAAAEALHDPLTAKEQALTGQPTVIPYLSHGILGESVKSATAEQFVPGVTDFPYVTQDVQAPANRIERALEQGPQVIPYLSHGMTADDVVGARPDDRADRFAHSDVPSQQLLGSSGGSSFEWNDALTVGIGGLVLALGLGLALGYLRRPRLAGL